MTTIRVSRSIVSLWVAGFSFCGIQAGPITYMLDEPNIGSGVFTIDVSSPWAIYTATDVSGGPGETTFTHGNPEFPFTFGLWVGVTFEALPGVPPELRVQDAKGNGFGWNLPLGVGSTADAAWNVLVSQLEQESVLRPVADGGPSIIFFAMLVASLGLIYHAVRQPLWRANHF
jgi:hypothetical protein